MKKKIFEYYKPSDKDLDVLWKKCLFIFDTSVLINLYEFSPKVRDEFLDILKKNSDRIWIPHQVAKEYQWRRPFAIREQRVIHQQLRNEFLEIQDKIIQDIEKSIQYHPFIDKTQLEDEVKKLFSNLIAYLKKCEENYPDLIKSDIVGEKIDSLFDGKVGTECDDSELQKIYTDGAKRYAQKIPPGFADKDAKDNFKQYGDLILWHQIIRHSISSKKPVIFVTNDQKNDWWFIYFQEKPFEKEILSPRPELIKEFFEKTQNSFYMYNPSDFMEASRKYLKQKVSDGAIKEVQNVSKKQETGYGRDQSGNYYMPSFANYQNELQQGRIPGSMRVMKGEPVTVSSGSIFLRSADDRTMTVPSDSIFLRSTDNRIMTVPSDSIFLRSTDDRNELRQSIIPESVRAATVDSTLNIDGKYQIMAKEVYTPPIVLPKDIKKSEEKKPPTRKKSS